MWTVCHVQQTHDGQVHGDRSSAQKSVRMFSFFRITTYKRRSKRLWHKNKLF
jgi:hypothetical protein